MPTDATDELLDSLDADRARAEGQRIFKAPTALVGSAETELVPAHREGESLSAARLSMLCTLAEPNVICVDAAEHRASLATRAGVLSQAIDAQVTAGAQNSIEKMLVHQMTTVHTVGMETIIRLQQTPTYMPPIEMARLINSAVRLFESISPAA